VESNKYFDDAAQKTKHCLRRNGTERAWFFTREQTEQYAASPSNPVYHGDIAHHCPKCGFYHLSGPEWLEPKFTPTDLQMLEDAGNRNAASTRRALPLLYLRIGYARRH
jgi:hypothetical protein